MDIQKELESFKTVAIAKGWPIDGETTQTNYRFYSLTTNSGWEMWQAAKAQAVPEGFVDMQSWIAVNSFSALDAVHENAPIIDANELAKYIDSLIEAQEQK